MKDIRINNLIKKCLTLAGYENAEQEIIRLTDLIDEEIDNENSVNRGGIDVNPLIRMRKHFPSPWKADKPEIINWLVCYTVDAAYNWYKKKYTKIKKAWVKRSKKYKKLVDSAFSILEEKDQAEINKIIGTRSKKRTNGNSSVWG